MSVLKINLPNNVVCTLEPDENGNYFNARKLVPTDNALFSAVSQRFDDWLWNEAKPFLEYRKKYGYDGKEHQIFDVPRTISYAIWEFIDYVVGEQMFEVDLEEFERFDWALYFEDED